MTLTCPDCGREEPPNVRYCVFCGAALSSGAAPAEEQTGALRAAVTRAAAALIAVAALSFIVAAGVAGVQHVESSRRHAEGASLLSLPDTSFLATGLTTELNPVLPPILPGFAPQPVEAAGAATPGPGAPATSLSIPTATGTPTAAGTATPASSSSLLHEFVRVGEPAGNGCVNVRETASVQAMVLHCLASGTLAQVVDGPQDADGYHWWKLDAGGWTAGTFLVDAGGAQDSASLTNLGATLGTSPGATISPSVQPGNQAGFAGAIAQASAQTIVSGYSGWVTYYGIEDGFVRGDIMNDGTPYDPADPTITAASFRIPMHTWLRVCTTVRCILVQVRDRGLLDENGIMLDLSRAAYALLFGGLNGKQWVSAYFVGAAPAASAGAGPIAAAAASVSP